MPSLPARPARRAALGRLAPLALLVPLALAGCENPRLGGLGDLTPPLEDDAPISRDVLAALAERPEIARFPITVKSLGEGTVRLSGRVDNDSQRHTAERTAAAVPGVRSVVNTIYLLE